MKQTQTEKSRRIERIIGSIISGAAMLAVVGTIGYSTVKSIREDNARKAETAQMEALQQEAAKYIRVLSTTTLLDDDRDGSWDRLYSESLGVESSRPQMYVKEGYSTGISQSVPGGIDVNMVKPEYFDQFNQRYPISR